MIQGISPLQRNNLFRFAIIKDPGLPSDQFIEDQTTPHPNPGSSVFVTAVNAVTTIEDKIAALETAVDNFTPLDTYKDVRSFQSGIYDSLFLFGRWLQEHKSDLVYTELEPEVTRPSLLSAADEIVIWDNLTLVSLIIKGKKTNSDI